MAVLACGTGSPKSGSFMIQEEPPWSQVVTGRGSLGNGPLLSHEVAFNNSKNRKVSAEKAVSFSFVNGLPFSEHMLIRILLVVSNRIPVHRTKHEDVEEALEDSSAPRC